MDRFVDAIKSSMSKLIEFTIHGEGDVKIARSIQEENFVLGGIDCHDKIDIGAGGKRQSVVTIVDATKVNSKRRIE